MKIKIKNKLITEEFDEGMLVLNMNTGKYLETNDIGLKIFNLLKKYGDTESVHLALKDEFDVPDNILRKDIESFVKDLEKFNILKTYNN